ncbi:hypothetical protein C8J56DRAFT_1026419, partial [Mycena floridula]
MPSFSLVRRFGKQRKVAVDSPVSSGLVEQHIRRQSQAGNVFSATGGANSHGLTSGLVALEGVSIGNIKGNMMSNNNININHYYRSAANFDASDAMLRVGDIYLEEEFKRYTFVDHAGWTRYRGHITTCSNLSMSIWTYRGERAAEALEKAYKKYASLPRSSVPWCTTFHGPERIFQNITIITIEHLFVQTQPEQSAHSMLEAHNLQGYQLEISDVDETGKLVIAHFMSGPTVHSAFDPQIWIAFETNTFIKEDLLDYYKFLFDMIDWSIYLPISTLLSPFAKAAPFQLFHPEINLPVYCLPVWTQVVNGMDITVGQTGIVLTLLPNMTIRY